MLIIIEYFTYYIAGVTRVIFSIMHLYIVGGAIRAIMMCIHAYFNIWCEAREGWTVFMKRRSAVYKISTLPEATPNQLQDFDDVCAICYQVYHMLEN